MNRKKTTNLNHKNNISNSDNKFILFSITIQASSSFHACLSFSHPIPEHVSVRPTIIMTLRSMKPYTVLMSHWGRKTANSRPICAIEWVQGQPRQFLARPYLKIKIKKGVWFCGSSAPQKQQINIFKRTKFSFPLGILRSVILSYIVRAIAELKAELIFQVGNVPLAGHLSVMQSMCLCVCVFVCL